MRYDEITSLTHARRVYRHAQRELSAHDRECVTCTPTTPCTIGIQLQRACERALTVRRSLASERE